MHYMVKIDTMDFEIVGGGGGDKVSVLKIKNILKKKIYYKSTNKYITVHYLQRHT